jgi:hypothetical protein
VGPRRAPARLHCPGTACSGASHIFCELRYQLAHIDPAVTLGLLNVLIRLISGVMACCMNCWPNSVNVNCLLRFPYVFLSLRFDDRSWTMDRSGIVYRLSSQNCR